MVRHARTILHLILGISGICVLGWFVNTYSPDNFWQIVLFFLIITGTIYFVALFLLKIVRRAMILTLCVVLWLFLRFLGLVDWYYPVLLTAIFISLEILFQKR